MAAKPRQARRSRRRRQPVKSLGMLLMGLLALIYLANPTAGIIEFLPDTLPGVGNLDEALAVVLLVRALAWFGIHLPGLDHRRDKEDDGPVVDVD